MAQSPQAWAAPWGRQASRGEWSGQCPINKSAVQAPGPRPPGAGFQALFGSGSCRRDRRPRPCSALCPPGEPTALWGSKGPTGRKRARSAGPVLWEQLCWQTWVWAAEAAGAVSATCPGRPGAAAPRSSGRSAGTSGSSPPLRSGTCGAASVAEEAPRSRKGICPRWGQAQDQGVPGKLGGETAHAPGRCWSELAPLSRTPI